MPDEADLGQAEAHTGEVEPFGGADPAELVDGLPIEGDDVLAMAAELVAGPRRARGRPAGSGNRKNGDMIAYLAAKGHRDPWLTLSMIQTADTLKLAEMLGKDMVDDDGRPVYRVDGTKVKIAADPMAVMAIQRQAAKDLMDYHHAKKPVQLELPPGVARPIMVLGDMNVAVAGDLSALAGYRPEPKKPNEINGESVRHEGALPHEKPSI